MKTNVAGRVERISLSARNSLLPLFEAVSNSIHAIRRLNREDGRISVFLRRDESRSQVALAGVDTESADQIVSIAVTDNGVGFDAENMAAFDELDTQHKQDLGGKGVGRLVWLRVFEKVEIDSVYRTPDGFRRRSLVFRLPHGVGKVTDRPLDQARSQDCRTTVTISEPREKYREALRSRVSTIASAVARHFMPTLLAAQSPRIEISDGKTTIEASPDDHADRARSEIAIKGTRFTIDHLRIKSPEQRQHSVFYCASERMVEAEKLRHLPDVALGDVPDTYFYQAYVASTFLDEHAGALRTRFEIDEDPILDGISFSDIRAEVKAEADAYLRDELARLNDVREQRIERVLRERLPELGYVTAYNQADIQSEIGLGATDAEVEQSLGEIHLRNQRTGRYLLSELVGELQASTTIDLAAFERTFAERVQLITQPSQASLANYMLFRRSIIDIYREILNKAGDRFAREAAVHNLLFPMGRDVDTAKGFQSNNLWLLDERLTYANYIASDRPISEHSVLFNAESGDEPDVACYFNLGFSEDDPAEGALRNVVIVELKRPGPLANKAENPWQQVMRYIDDMHEASWSEGGQKIKASAETRFYCFIVCDLDNRTIDVLRRQFGFTPVFDGHDGYTFYNKDYKAYVELIPFERVVRDAERKHRAFFERLALPPVPLKTPG